MGFIRDALPEPVDYFESCGLTFRERKGVWRTTRCEFHGGRDSLRVNTRNGAWVCMACNAKGGDVLAYEMAREGSTFVEAAKRLGCWQDDGKPEPARPAPFSARDGLSVLHYEATLIAVYASDLAGGKTLAQPDHERLLQAIGRVNRVVAAAAL
ncbi:MAG: hypothetical protein BGO13_07030 [Burkholderiales bacterium 66-5]|nr:MAG: hypothetical protein BGO13_07030 [Burkholderiales bacterium 66-5]